jgi:hypothetical protein
MRSDEPAQHRFPAGGARSRPRLPYGFPHPALFAAGRLRWIIDTLNYATSTTPHLLHWRAASNLRRVGPRDATEDVHLNGAQYDRSEI